MELFLNNSYVGIIHTHTHTHIYIVRCVSVCVSGFSCVQLFVTLQTVAHQAPLSMGFSRQEYRVAMPSSRGSSQPRDQTCASYVSCTGRCNLYHQHHLGGGGASTVAL